MANFPATSQRHQTKTLALMSLTVNSAAAIPTNEEMSSFLTGDPSHVEAVEGILDGDIKKADRHEAAAKKESPHIGGRPLTDLGEVRHVGVAALAEVNKYVAPSYETQDAPIVLASEAWLNAAVKMGIGQFVMSVVTLGGLNAMTDLSSGNNLVFSAMSLGIYLSRLRGEARFVYRSPALYELSSHRIITREVEIHALRTVVMHEGTHSIQVQNPKWDRYAIMMPNSPFIAFVEGQAISVEHHLGVTVEPDNNGLAYFTLRDEIGLLTYAYAMLCRAHSRTPRKSLTGDHFVQESLQQEQEAWLRNPHHIVGAAAFAIARHKGTLPSHREILDGNFGFVRG